MLNIYGANALKDRSKQKTVHEQWGSINDF